MSHPDFFWAMKGGLEVLNLSDPALSDDFPIQNQYKFHLSRSLFLSLCRVPIFLPPTSVLLTTLCSIAKLIPPWDFLITPWHTSQYLINSSFPAVFPRIVNSLLVWTLSKCPYYQECNKHSKTLYLIKENENTQYLNSRGLLKGFCLMWYETILI